jgi:hypothetical protein
MWLMVAYFQCPPTASKSGTTSSARQAYDRPDKLEVVFSCLSVKSDMA